MNEQLILEIQELIGRRPLGLKEVMLRNSSGIASVVRVAPLVKEKPFPTIFWLVDPQLKKRIDQLEAIGLIQKLEERLLVDKELSQNMENDHKAYISLREDYMTTEEKAFLKENNYFNQLQMRGIGGISNLGKIRCLHMHYAFHLIRPTTIGNIIETYLNLEMKSNT